MQRTALIIHSEGANYEVFREQNQIVSFESKIIRGVGYTTFACYMGNKRALHSDEVAVCFGATH
jgi:hypothetical protein